MCLFGCWQTNVLLYIFTSNFVDEARMLKKEKRDILYY